MNLSKFAHGDAVIRIEAAHLLQQVSSGGGACCTTVQVSPRGPRPTASDSALTHGGSVSESGRLAAEIGAFSNSFASQNCDRQIDKQIAGTYR